MQKGIKYDSDKPRFDLLVPEFIEEMAKVMTFGANKYAPDNWKKVENGYQRYLGAAYRHLNADHKGEDNDNESGLSHLAHAACCLMMMYWFKKNHTEG